MAGPARPGRSRSRAARDRISLGGVRGQLLSAYRLLESECAVAKDWLFGGRPLQPDITAAVAWAFPQHALANVVEPGEHPALCSLSKRAEALPEFLSALLR